MVLIIMGSVRAGRRCPKIAEWVKSVAETSSELSYELVDLLDWPLPMDDEASIPAQGGYEQSHTLAWGRKVAAAAGFIFVTPQYNWGYPAALKNAIDHLYKEWEGKPVVIVSYGGHGGGKCAVQLRQVVEGMHMKPVATMPGITLTREMIGGGSVNPAADFKDAEQTVRTAMQELVVALAESAT
jgi:NAD(P)H-dependent FMN reductase